MSWTRRDAMMAAGAALAATTAQPASSGTGADRLVLLGTKGGPSIRRDEPNPSANLLVHNNIAYVVDAGYGVTRNLVQSGLPLPSIAYLLITHHHSDHNLEAGALLYNAWVNGLRNRVGAYGPSGMETLLSSFWEANQYDIETRMSDEGRPDPRRLVRVREYADGLVLQNADMKVTAMRTMHPPVTDSFALKFEFAGNIVVFSGDSAYYPPLAVFAKGADYLIHEAMYGPALDALVARNPNAARLMAHLKASHTLAEDVGRIAAEAKPQTLVLNHFVPADPRQVTPEMWIEAVRKTYDGNIVVGRDLLELPL